MSHDATDTLAIILATVRESLLRATPLRLAANDEQIEHLDDALQDAELRARRILGGARHYIQRLPKIESLTVIELLPANLSVRQMSQRTGLPMRTIQRLLAESRARMARPAANDE